jgi:hypothetical protein
VAVIHYLWHHARELDAAHATTTEHNSERRDSRNILILPLASRNDNNRRLCHLVLEEAIRPLESSLDISSRLLLGLGFFLDRSAISRRFYGSSQDGGDPSITIFSHQTSGPDATYPQLDQYQRKPPISSSFVVLVSSYESRMIVPYLARIFHRGFLVLIHELSKSMYLNQHVKTLVCKGGCM